MSQSTKPDASSETITDAAEALQIVQEQRRRTSLNTNMNSYAHYGVWGVAWLAGYCCLALGTGQTAGGETATKAWSFIIFAIILAAAFVSSIVINLRGASGIRSTDPLFHYFSRAGAIFGWSFLIAFAIGMCGLGLIASRFDLSNTSIAVLYNFVAPLILGLIYWLGGAIFSDRTMLVSGIWMMLLSWSTILAGIPMGYWIMAFVGGGGLLVAFIVSTILVRRRADASDENATQEQTA